MPLTKAVISLRRPMTLAIKYTIWKKISVPPFQQKFKNNNFPMDIIQEIQPGGSLSPIAVPP